MGGCGISGRRQGNGPQEAHHYGIVDGSLSTFPTLDMLREGYEVYPVVDAVGGTSVEAHRAGLERIFQAGGHPTSWAQLMCELQRDWNREETVKAFIDILFDPRVPFLAAERSAKTVQK